MDNCTVHKLISGVVLIAGGKTLLVKYKDTSEHDGQTGWFHPDDVLAPREEPEEGAARILKDQPGLAPKKLEFGLFESFGGQDTTHHLMFHYKAAFPKQPILRLGKNIAKAEWFPLGKLPPKSECAHHGWAVDVVKRVAGR